MHGRCIDYQSSHFGLIDEIESGNEGLLLFCQGVGMEQDSKMKKNRRALRHGGLYRDNTLDFNEYIYKKDFND